MKNKLSPVLIIFSEAGSCNEQLLQILLKQKYDKSTYGPQLIQINPIDMNLIFAPDLKSFHEEKNLLSQIIQYLEQNMKRIKLPIVQFGFYLKNGFDELQGFQKYLFDELQLGNDQITFFREKEILQYKKNKQDKKKEISFEKIKKWLMAIESKYKSQSINKTCPLPSNAFDNVFKNQQLEVKINNFISQMQFLFQSKQIIQETQEKKKMIAHVADNELKSQDFQHENAIQNQKQNLNDHETSIKLQKSNIKNNYFQGKTLVQIQIQHQQLQPQIGPGSHKINKLNKNIPSQKVSAVILSCEEQQKSKILKKLCSAKKGKESKVGDFTYFFFQDTFYELIDAPIFTFIDDCEEKITIFSQFFSNTDLYYIFLFLEYQRIDIMKKRLDLMLKNLFEVDRNQMALVITDWQKSDQVEEDKEMINQLAATRNICKSMFFSCNDCHQLLFDQIYESMSERNLEKLKFVSTIFAQELCIPKPSKIPFRPSDEKNSVFSRDQSNQSTKMGKSEGQRKIQK